MTVEGVTRVRPRRNRAQGFEVHDYYPFGMRHETQVPAEERGEDYRYEYTGAERVGAAIGLDLTDLNARWLDPALGRFLSPDPAADLYPDLSPYAYVGNDPINMVDPTGMYIEEHGSGTTYTGEDAVAFARAHQSVAATGGNESSSDCPPGVPCEGSDDNVGLIRDPSDFETRSDGMLLARGAYYLLAYFTPLNVIDNAIVKYQDSETTGDKLGAVVEAAGAVVTTTRGGAGRGARISPRAARRQAMRGEGIPTSSTPASQSRNASGREYTYETPTSGGGKELRSVQQQTMDQSHPGQSHWEAGRVKVDDAGRPRTNRYGRPRLVNDKTKVDY